MMHPFTPLNLQAAAVRNGLQRISANTMFEESYTPAPQQVNLTGRNYQLRHECAGWRRLLSFLIEENVQLKSLVPEILSSSGDKVLLAGIEQFQDRFIREDGVLSLLRNDIAGFEKMLQKEETESGKYSEQLYRKLDILRNNLQTLETQFSKLRSEYFRFLLEKA
jgi:hypothetical protein